VSVEDDVRDVIKSLVSKKNNEVRYPKFIEIQKEVKVYLEVTEGDKWAIIRNMKITEGETVKNFNTIIEDHIIIIVRITKNLLLLRNTKKPLVQEFFHVPRLLYQKTMACKKSIRLQSWLKKMRRI